MKISTLKTISESQKLPLDEKILEYLNKDIFDPPSPLVHCYFVNIQWSFVYLIADFTCDLVVSSSNISRGTLHSFFHYSQWQRHVFNSIKE